MNDSQIVSEKSGKLLFIFLGVAASALVAGVFYSFVAQQDPLPQVAKLVANTEEVRGGDGTPYPVRWTGAAFFDPKKTSEENMQRNIDLTPLGPSRSLATKEYKGKPYYPKTCAEYFELGGSGWTYSFEDEVTETYFRLRCYPLQYLTEARPARVSFLSDFKLDANWKDLPLLSIGSWGRDTYLGDAPASVLKGFEVSASSPYSLSLENRTSGWRVRIVLYGWGDVNADGFEDMILSVSEGDGKWGIGQMYVVSKTSSGNPLFKLSGDPYLVNTPEALSFEGIIEPGSQLFFGNGQVFDAAGSRFGLPASELDALPKLADGEYIVDEKKLKSGVAYLVRKDFDYWNNLYGRSGVGGRCGIPGPRVASYRMLFNSQVFELGHLVAPYNPLDGWERDYENGFEFTPLLPLRDDGVGIIDYATVADASKAEDVAGGVCRLEYIFHYFQEDDDGYLRYKSLESGSDLLLDIPKIIGGACLGDECG